MRKKHFSLFFIFLWKTIFSHCSKIFFKSKSGIKFLTFNFFSKSPKNFLMLQTCVKNLTFYLLFNFLKFLSKLTWLLLHWEKTNFSRQPSKNCLMLIKSSVTFGVNLVCTERLSIYATIFLLRLITLMLCMSSSH